MEDATYKRKVFSFSYMPGEKTVPELDERILKICDAAAAKILPAYATDKRFDEHILCLDVGDGGHYSWSVYYALDEELIPKEYRVIYCGNLGEIGICPLEKFVDGKLKVSDGYWTIGVRSFAPKMVESHLSSAVAKRVNTYFMKNSCSDYDIELCADLSKTAAEALYFCVLASPDFALGARFEEHRLETWDYTAIKDVEKTAEKAADFIERLGK